MCFTSIVIRIKYMLTGDDKIEAAAHRNNLRKGTSFFFARIVCAVVCFSSSLVHVSIYVQILSMSILFSLSIAFQLNISSTYESVRYD